MREYAYPHCFGCGTQNPQGLHLQNTYVDGKACISFTVDEYHTGYPGLLHGGVTCTLLDEAMFYAVLALDVETVTTEMTVRYLKPAKLGHSLICEAWVEFREGRRIEAHAIIRDQAEGTRIAEAQGKYLEVDLARLLQK